MAATIKIIEICKGVANDNADQLLPRRATASWSPNAGVSGTDFLDKTAGTIRFKRAINPTVDVNDPIPIPNAGTNYSYEKVLCFYVGDDDNKTVTNFGFYTDGNINWTGVTLYARIVAPAWDADGDAGKAVGYTKPVLTHAAGFADAATFTAGAKLAMNADDPNLVAGGNDDNRLFGDLLYLQVGVGSTASAGTLAAETMTFTYDEA